MAASATTQEIYAKVQAYIAEGMTTSAACGKVGEQLGRPRASIATTYYRQAAKDPASPTRSSRRGRPRKQATPSRVETTIAPPPPSAPGTAIESTLLGVAAELERLREENARLSAQLDAVRRAIA